MNILDEVKNKLNKFKEEKQTNQAIKLNKDLLSTRREYANAKIKEEVIKNKEYIRSVKAKEREQRFAGLRSFGQKINERTAKRGKNPVSLGRSPGSTGNIFTATSNTPNSIYFKGSEGNNPFNFSGNGPVQAKEKKKRIIIQL